MLWWPFLELIMKFILMVQSKYLNEHNWLKKIQNFSKAKKFYYQSNKLLKIMYHQLLVGVKIWFVPRKALEMTSICRSYSTFFKQILCVDVFLSLQWLVTTWRLNISQFRECVNQLASTFTLFKSWRTEFHKKN